MIHPVQYVHHWTSTQWSTVLLYSDDKKKIFLHSGSVVKHQMFLAPHKLCSMVLKCLFALQLQSFQCSTF